MMNDNLQDAEERERALDPRYSFIVQAPAGSGKTELLTQRFLVLLSIVKQPEEILSITFTKKSAAEMRSRILFALSNAMENPEPETIHAKKTWKLAKNALKQNQHLGWNLLQNPNRLQIQTIDSFNASLTRQLPLLSRFGANVEIADNPYFIYREAVQEFLSHLEENLLWSNAIEKLLFHMDNDLNKVESLLINMLAKRDQWLPYIALNVNNPELRKTLENHLAAINIDHLTNLKNTFPQELIDEVIQLLKFAAENLTRDNYDSPITTCINLEKLPGIKITDKKNWLGIAKLLLTDNGEWRKKVDKRLGFPASSDAILPDEKNILNKKKTDFKNLLDKLATKTKLKTLLYELTMLPNPRYENFQWETLEALHEILRVLVAQLRLSFQAHGKIDYIENAHAAYFALGTIDDPTDLTLALDYKIHHILIDEFQDTSNTQYRLLEKLTMGWQENDGRTLFIVGDPMQSIYRFREAEVGLFIRARKNGIGHLSLKPLTLTVNFRSLPSIINWVNIHFDKILPNYEDIGMGAVSYKPSMAAKSDDSKDTVKIHSFFNSSKEVQAETITQLIQELQLTEPKQSIAILVRSRSHLKNIIPSLKKAHIPFRALDIEPLETRPIIQDLLALVRALLYPADKIAWLAILRAPWCGLSLKDLFIISNERDKAIIWEQLQSIQIRKQLSEEGQIAVSRLLSVLTPALLARRRFTLRFWLENTWLLLGGPACVSHPNDLEDAEAFFKLIEKLDDHGDLPSVSSLLDAMKNLYAVPNNLTTCQLHIMTIHNAKGLEFDTVILPHLESKASLDERQLLMWLEQPRPNKNTSLVLAPIHAVNEKNNLIYDYIKRQHDIKINYEMARLLYVAVTRAKRKLHLFFNLEENSQKELKKPASNSLLEKLMPALKDPIKNLEKQNILLENASLNHSISSFKRLTTTWKNPLHLNVFEETSSNHNQKLGFDLPNDTPRQIGTLIHKILQKISELGFAWWQNETLESKKNSIQNQLQHLGMHRNNLTHAVSIIEKAIENTLNDGHGKWILQPHLEAQSEFPITTTNKQLIIDRTFIDENNIRWIIDYKTSIYSSDDLENFLLAEQKKYESQLMDYHSALKELDSRTIKVGLYFPLIPAWKEWEFVSDEIKEFA